MPDSDMAGLNVRIEGVGPLVPVNVERLASKWENEADIIEQSTTGKRLARLAAAEALRACARDLRSLPDLNPALVGWEPLVGKR